MHTCMLHIFENISRERPTGCNTKIDADRVEWCRVNIWVVLHTFLAKQ